MKEFKGTPGEWEIIEHNWSDTSIMSGGKTICTVSIYDEATEETQDELEAEVLANFKVIKTAPKMLEMLKVARDKFMDLKYDKNLPELQEMQDEIEALIKEATE